MSNCYITGSGLVSEDELKHYGVIGMRWGIRKARKSGTTYTYKSHGQKKWEKKYDAAKANGESNKADKARVKYETFKKRDKNRQDYAETTTVGKAVVKGLLTGPFGAGNYNRMRAAGHTRVASMLQSNWISSTLTLPYQIIMTRDDEFVSAR